MSRRTKRSPGRPSLLTSERQARLYGIVEEGNHLTTACAVVGIGTSTLYRWMEIADDAEAQQNDPTAPPITPAQAVYLEFRDGLRLARARAEMRAVGVIEKAMRGGSIISERALQNAEGELVTDPMSGEVLYERQFTQPDGRLALSYLARSSPSAWGQNPTHKVEIHGAGPVAGGDGEEMSDDQAANLARQLAAVAARVREDQEQDRLELESGVVDAVVVEDESA